MVDAALATMTSAAVVSCESLTKDLLDTAKEARGGDGWGAAVSAYRTVALLHGLITKKVDIDTRGGEFHIIRRLPDETISKARPDPADR